MACLSPSHGHGPAQAAYGLAMAMPNPCHGLGLPWPPNHHGPWPCPPLDRLLGLPGLALALACPGPGLAHGGHGTMPARLPWPARPWTLPACLPA
jgi:hypothetical protein